MNQSPPERKANGLHRLFRDVNATRDDEIQCDVASIRMVQCVQHGLPEEVARREYADLFHHLQFCAGCASEYQLLRELTEREASGQLPRPTRIPPRPDKKPSPRTDWNTRLFGGFMPLDPALASRLRRDTTLGLAPAISPLDEQTTLELDLTQSKSTPDLRELLCQVTTTDIALAELLEGARIWLEDPINDRIMYEEQLDSFGSALFNAVQPGQYRLRLRLTTQEYALENLVLP